MSYCKEIQSIRLNYWGRVINVFNMLLVRPIVFRIWQPLSCLINIPLLQKPEGSLPCLQKPNTGPYLEPDECSPYPPTCPKFVSWKFLFPLQVMYGRPRLWSSGQSSWLHIQRSRIPFPALADFLRSNGSGIGSTQPREDN
jgi:hypothetical protein